MKNIINRIRSLYPVSDESLDAFVACLKKEVIPSKTIIIEGDKFNRNIYFIEKGITRSFSLFEGKEVTTWFTMEGGEAGSSFSM